MPENIVSVGAAPHMHASRPLMGLTVLVVEDSRFASEALRLLCIRSGARIRRAASLMAARRHLLVYRPSVVIADIGLPDGSGIELIEELSTDDANIRPVLIAISGADGEGIEQASIAAGADEFLAKPFTSISQFQHIILSNLPKGMRPMRLQPINNECVNPDKLAFNEDLEQLDMLLENGEKPMTYIATFLQGLVRLTNDEELSNLSESLNKIQQTGQSNQSIISEIRAAIQDRLKLCAVT